MPAKKSPRSTVDSKSTAARRPSQSPIAIARRVAERREADVAASVDALLSQYRGGLQPEAMQAFDKKEAHYRKILTRVAPEMRWSFGVTVPARAAWGRLLEHLRAAANDPVVKSSATALGFLDVITELASDSVSARTVDEVFEPLNSIFAVDAQSAKGKARHAGNAAAKAWVLDEWNKNADEYSRKKVAFADAYEALVRKKFGTSTTERTIRTRWLKGKS